MQFIFLIIVFIALLAFIIYKINNKFETKEIFILIVVILIPILSFTFIKEIKKKEFQIFLNKNMKKRRIVKLKNLVLKELIIKLYLQNMNLFITLTTS